MSRVFISYRQTDDEQRQRVRSFGERLRRCGIDVVLDQFFLDANPGGPNDGWDKWSSDRTLQTEYVLASSRPACGRDLHSAGLYQHGAREILAECES